MYRLGLGKKPDVCVNPTFGLFGKNANRFEKPRLYMLYSVSAKFTVLFPCNMYVPNCMRESVVSRQISGRFPMSHVDLGFCREGGLRSHVDLGTIGLTGPRSQDDMGQNPRLTQHWWGCRQIFNLGANSTFLGCDFCSGFFCTR